MEELKSTIPRTSQYHPGHEIPEKNLYYRIAKKFLFNDRGETELRGFEDPVRLFDVRWREST